MPLACSWCTVGQLDFLIKTILTPQRASVRAEPGIGCIDQLGQAGQGKTHHFGAPSFKMNMKNRSPIQVSIFATFSDSPNHTNVVNWQLPKQWIFFYVTVVCLFVRCKTLTINKFN